MKLASYTIERRFTVAPDRLFRAFTVPAELEAWVWGEYGIAVRAVADLRVNGTFDITADLGREGRGGMRGVYLQIEPGRRLVHTLHWDAPVGYNGPGMNPLDEVVVVDVLPDGDGSLLRYHHLGIPDDGASCAAHERAVRGTLDLLERHVRPA